MESTSKREWFELALRFRRRQPWRSRRLHRLVPKPESRSSNPESRSSNPESQIPNPCFACLYQPPYSGACGHASALLAIAREFSPRYEVHRDDLVTIDISGLGRLLGD